MSFERLQPTTTLGDYEILSYLDEGRWSIVYQARHVITHEMVALKVFREARPQIFSLYQQKLRSVIQSPVFPPLLGVGATPGGANYIALPLYTGKTIEDHLRAGGSFSIDDVLSIIVSLVDALSALAQPLSTITLGHIFLHREASGRLQPIILGIGEVEYWRAPPNTLIGPSIARGQVALMCPDRLNNRFDLITNDIYSLGALWYFMLTGELPYPAESPFQMMTRILMEPFPEVRHKRPDLPESHARVLRKMTAKESSARYQSFAQVQQALSLLSLRSGQRSYFFGHRELPLQSLTAEARERLSSMRRREFDPLRIKSEAWYSRMIGGGASFWYLHPCYLIGYGYKSLRVFSWAYLHEVGLRDDWVSLSFVEDFRQFSSLRKSNRLAPSSSLVVRFQYSDGHELFEALRVFVENTRTINFQKQAHLAPEAMLFPEMLNWRPA
jgi:serine/threonine protein kinase